MDTRCAQQVWAAGSALRPDSAFPNQPPPLSSHPLKSSSCWIFLISGVVGLFTTLRGRHVPGYWWSLLSAIVGIVAGVLLLGWPAQGVFSLTSVLIAFLLVEGAITIFYALEHRSGPVRWGYMLASGIVDLILGIILFAGLPGTATWAIGLLIGINMFFGGWALILMALSTPTQVSATPVT